jgi:uncharacterized protein
MNAQKLSSVWLPLEKAASNKAKLLISLEVLAVFLLLLALRISLRTSSVLQWEFKNLGWTYSLMLLWLGIVALVIWLTRRGWAAFGISSINWRTNFDIGVKAYLIRIIPVVLGGFGAAWLGLQPNSFGSFAFSTLVWGICLALLVWVFNHQKEVKSGRANIIITLILLLLPVGVALFYGKLTLVIVSTIFWQFIFSGFGEEFIYRGYVQSRINQAFGRPLRLFGVQFGIGLLIASLLFGLLHVFNGFDPAIGWSSLAWWMLWDNVLAGLFLGVIREKTGTLFAPGIAHGLPDAVGEPLIIIFGWEAIFH